jgi:hypothetical protein
MWKAREGIIRSPEDERDQQIDDFLSSFRVDQLSLFGTHGIIEGTP